MSGAASASPNQAICNGASVSTDPTLTAVNSYQKCNATDPASAINTNISNIAGNAVVQGMALGNSFEADSNAPNMPIVTKQINNSHGRLHRAMPMSPMSAARPA